MRSFNAWLAAALAVGTLLQAAPAALGCEECDGKADPRYGGLLDSDGDHEDPVSSRTGPGPGSDAGSSLSTHRVWAFESLDPKSFAEMKSALEKIDGVVEVRQSGRPRNIEIRYQPGKAPRREVVDRLRGLGFHAG